MSDYGFATYDEKTGKVSEKINSKYPIFGPEYRGIVEQFKTIHIEDVTEASVEDLPSVSIPIPTDAECWMDGQDHYYGANGGPQGYFDEMVYSYKHGFKKRPLGYAIITGKLKLNRRYVLVQDQVSGMSMGGDFRVPVSGDGTATFNLMLSPDMGSMTQSGMGDNNEWENPITVRKDGDVNKNIIIPNACDNSFVKPFIYHLDFENGEAVDQSPYRVEIDDEYVKIYRRSFWGKTVRRAYQTYPSYAAYNVNQTITVVDDYAGSSLDVTIYLVPYSLEDLG